MGSRAPPGFGEGCRVCRSEMKTFVLALTLVVAADAARMKSCADPKDSAKLQKLGVKITGCVKGRKDCDFIIGELANITLPFTPKVNVENLTTRVKGILMGNIEIPFPLPRGD